MATSEKEKEDAFFVRRKVFVEEQGIPENIEIDEHDATAIHFVAYEQNNPIGAGRLRIFHDYGKAERVSVLPSHRKKGVGALIMSAMEDVLKNEGMKKLTLHAQLQAKPFYEKIGFKQTSEIFYEANTPHISMEKSL